MVVANESLFYMQFYLRDIQCCILESSPGCGFLYMVAYRKQPDLVCVTKAAISRSFLSVIQGDVIGRRMGSVWEDGRHDKGSLILSFACPINKPCKTTLSLCRNFCTVLQAELLLPSLMLKRPTFECMSHALHASDHTLLGRET